MKRTRRDLTMAEAKQAVRWIELLASTLGCAGQPACDPDGDGELCTACNAREWLDKLKQRGRRWYET